MKRKWLAIGIILLFVGIAYAPAMAQNSEKQSVSRGTWLYVGGSGPGNYTRIQDAIDNASPQDTIIIYKGIYNESLTIPIPLSLIGIDAPLINSTNEPSVNIMADGCLLEKLHFKIAKYRICLHLHSKNNHINHCTVFDAYKGLLLNTSDNNIITNNLFTDGSYGILLFNSDNNTIMNNTLLSHRYLTVWIDYGSDYNLFKNNTIVGSKDYQGINNRGESSHNQFIDNTITMRKTLCLTIVSGTNLSVIGNRFYKNGMSINVPLEHLLTYTLENNTLDDRPIIIFINKTGLTVPTDGAQALLFSCTNCVVKDLIISGHLGIQVISGNNTIIQNNTLISSVSYTESLTGMSISKSSHTVLANNTISSYSNHISIEGGDAATITNNNITFGWYGVSLISCLDFIIKNNIISHISCAISGQDSNYLEIENNIMRDTIWGIELTGSNISLLHNIISNTSHGSHQWCTRVSGNDIALINNIFSNNSYSVSLTGSNIDVQGNVFSANKNGGLYCNCDTLSITSNTFENNHGYGLTLNKCRSVVVKKNNFISNNVHVVFENSLFIRWSRNYWKPSFHIGPKLILGNWGFIIYTAIPWDDDIHINIPFPNFDFFPAIRPYNIPETG